jgi:hypothetical protein
MGARINYVFSVGEEQPAVVLYSHWGADEWESSIAMALRHAKKRLSMGDTSYATRNIISWLTQGSVLSETGFGIYAVSSPSAIDAWDLTVIVDLANKVIDGHSFDEFCDYHLGAEEKEEANA